MLNPIHPAPVVAGNVETSQTLIDVLKWSDYLFNQHVTEL